MGPHLLVDKSFLRLINKKEASALEKHYTIVINPVALQELISDLADQSKTQDELARLVVILANKAAGSKSYVLMDARAMIEANLLGHPIPLSGQIPKPAKEIVAPDGSKGFVVEQSKEEVLLRNWCRGEFTDQDRAIAGQLKRDLKEYDLPGSQKEMREQFPNNTRFESLEDLVRFIDATDDLPFNKSLAMEALMKWCGTPDSTRKKIQSRWEELGNPSLKSFAPYAHYCSRVLSIYFIGVTADLIRTGMGDKTMIDMFYLLYLPFSHSFASRDAFHRDMFRYFARGDQAFIWGDDLKPDLDQIASFHGNLSEPDRLAYAREFGHYPPPIPNSITQEAWVRHMRPWTPGSGNQAIGMSTEEQKKIIDEIRKKTGLDF